MVWADIGRVLAIYLVVMVHTVNSPQILPMLGVPVFVMLSGAFLLGKSENYPDFWSKRLLRLLKPWIFWALFIGVFEVLVNRSSFNLFLTYVRTDFVTTWFMPVIFGLYLLTPVIRIFVKSAKTYDLWGLIVLWYLAVSVMPYFRNTAAFPIFSGNGIIEQILHFLGYYLLGFAIIKQGWSGKSISFGLTVAGLVITGVMSKAQPYFLDYQAPGIVLVSAGLFGLLYNFKDYFQKRITGKAGIILANISKTSLGVMFVHLLVLPYIPRSISVVWVRGVIVFVLSFSIILILQKVPKLGRWVS